MPIKRRGSKRSNAVRNVPAVTRRANKTGSLKNLLVRQHHTAFSCRDWKKTRSFFIDLLGFKVAKEIKFRKDPEIGTVAGLKGGRCHWVLLEFGGYYIELLKWLSPKGKRPVFRQCDIGLSHICIEVKDAQEARRRLLNARYATLSPVQQLRGGRAAAFYCRGPDGIMVEFAEFRENRRQ